jgi:hypothetical protein
VPGRRHPTGELADVVLPVAGDIPEMLSPLAYCVAPEMLAYHFAMAGGKTMLGFEDDWRKWSTSGRSSAA